jgi:radical SAM protein with 4Fe4S-binding SPASM domain
MVSESFFRSESLPEYALWKSVEEKRIPFSFDLEVTARCNNACRHCYINLGASDPVAKRQELSLVEIQGIVHQAVDLGALWCLVTGGEPLLRQDFSDIYLMLKKQGLLVSVFTNACLVTPEHVKLFQNYPPRDIEVTVYGVSAQTYEKVTRRPGSYAAFRRGLDRLLEGDVRVRLKAMALRSNYQELPEIGRFCRAHTWDYFRFDPLLHLRYDGDQQRNEEIKSERLSPAEIVTLEQNDEERRISLQKECKSLDQIHPDGPGCDHLFHCGAGQSSFTVGYDGTFRLCSSLFAHGCTVDLRQQTLADAWYGLVPKVRDLRSSSEGFRQTCRICPLVDLCLWCPANGHLECGEMDGHSEYFCQVAHARAEAVSMRSSSQP